jgi:hypothetical protein
MRVSILNEIINAQIKDIILPEHFTYNWDRMIESSRETNEPIKIILSNGEILELYGMLRLSDD